MCCTNADYIAFLKTIFTRILGCLPRVCLRLTSTMSGNIQKCLRTSSPVALFIYSFIFSDLRYTMFLNQHKYTWSCKKIVFTYCLTTRLCKNKPLAQKKSHHDFPFHTSVLIGALVYHKALRTMCTFKEISVRIYYSLNKKNTSNDKYWNCGEYGIVAKFEPHDDVIKWKHFPRYWPFAWGIHRSLVISPHRGQWCGPLVFSLICASRTGWVNNGGAGDLRRHGAHYDVTVIFLLHSIRKFRHSEK